MKIVYLIWIASLVVFGSVESQPDSDQSGNTESYVYDEQLTNNPQFESETPESQPDSDQSGNTESYVYDEQLTNNPQFESETPESQPDSDQSGNTESYVYDEQLTNNPQFESETPDEYRKALEEDTSFNYKVLANKGLYNQTKTHISKKWENRKTLDILEDKYFAETSSNLMKDEVEIEMIKKHLKEAKEAVKTSRVKLEWLEEAAVTATHQHRDILSTMKH
ncbi:unnamed protein product [Trichobilharzia szidati]|nr:unnamed protein product [Trichobilharzia szidati]